MSWLLRADLLPDPLASTVAGLSAITCNLSLRRGIVAGPTLSFVGRWRSVNLAR